MKADFLLHNICSDNMKGTKSVYLDCETSKPVFVLAPKAFNRFTEDLEGDFPVIICQFPGVFVTSSFGVHEGLVH